ncbi:hypothetical protein J6590_066847 [Homalodisca vitripennis]|nr:hypothetical protein J6590_066847 [Homalodisca vitripennis]
MYSENDTSYHRRARWRDSRKNTKPPPPQPKHTKNTNNPTPPNRHQLPSQARWRDSEGEGGYFRWSTGLPILDTSYHRRTRWRDSRREKGKHANYPPPLPQPKHRSKTHKQCSCVSDISDGLLASQDSTPVTIAGPDGVTRGGRRVSTLITLHLSPNQNIAVKHTNSEAALRILPMVCWPPRTRHQLPSQDLENLLLLHNYTSAEETNLSKQSRRKNVRAFSETFGFDFDSSLQLGVLSFTATPAVSFTATASGPLRCNSAASPGGPTLPLPSPSPLSARFDPRLDIHQGPVIKTAFSARRMTRPIIRAVALGG